MVSMTGPSFYSNSPFWRKLLFSVIFAAFFVWFNFIRADNSILTDLSVNSLRYVYHEEKQSKLFNSTEAKRLINKYNQEEKILNIDMFGELENNTVILVISVSKLHEPLKYLIASLCDLQGIQETLLVFSHLTFDEILNNFIQSIDFCRVLQIFYPYSLQVFKNEFPGYQKYDCSSNMNKENGKPLQCRELTRDIHGRYRQPSQAEKKHYWWWTANRIFEHLLSANNHNGIVVFLEDDVFVLSDFLYMVKYMYKLSKSMPQCEFLYLGLHEWSLDNNTYNVDITTWDPKHSSALVFDVPVWNIIVRNYDLFCNIDDSSWTRSLLYISLNRKNNKRFKVLYTTIPRAIKITLCFFNGLYNNCNVIDNVKRALSMQRYLKTNLFPPYLEVHTHIELEYNEFVIFDILQGEGGWNDHRDKELCMMNITQNKMKKILMEMADQLSIVN